MFEKQEYYSAVAIFFCILWLFFLNKENVPEYIMLATSTTNGYTTTSTVLPLFLRPTAVGEAVVVYFQRVAITMKTSCAGLYFV